MTATRPFLPEGHWDAIVIGSGVGGLVSAALLAKVDLKKVLVIEQHIKPGGFTHTFRRKGFEFDTGVHYIGELNKGSRLRAMLDYLTDGRLQWRALPYDYDRMLFDEFEWSVPSSRREHLEKLIRRFPDEERALRSYFRLEKKTADGYGLWQFAEKFAWPLRQMVRFALRIFRPQTFHLTINVLRHLFKDEQLISILGSRWMGFGIPPEQSCFGMHCVHGIHYGEGAWYPEKGGQSIADELIASIELSGGEILLRTKVRNIETKNGKVIGVRVLDREGTERHFSTERIVSNAGSRKTYLELLSETEPIPFREELSQSAYGTSVLSLFMGLKQSPRALGFEAANYWFCPKDQHKILLAEQFHGEPFWCFLSFPSLKQGSTEHTAQAILMTDTETFQRWAGTKWRRRPEDYEAFKARLTRYLLAEIERRYPGFSDLIEFSELSTPLSVEHFHGAPRGAVYGIPTVPARFSMPWTSSRTPIRGLFLTGSDVFCPGISGAIHGALKTADVMKASPI